MGRFFIHIENCAGVQRDEVGGEFASAALAVGEAAKMAGELLRDDVRDSLDEHCFVVSVESEGGDAVGRITLAFSPSIPT